MSTSPNSDDRLRRRRQRSAKAKAERQRARQLNAPITQPEPNATVQAHLKSAQKRRQLAGMAVDRKTRGEHQSAAADHERAAATAWQDQLERHWKGHADAELKELMDPKNPLVAPRNDALEETLTAVGDFVRDEHGALVTDKGLPVYREVRASTLRRKSGLDWELSKDRISAEQHHAGTIAAGIWADAAQAAEPGRIDEGSPGAMCKAPTGPADWKFEAMNRLKKMEVAILEPVGGAHGESILRVCRLVCHEGRTVREIAGDNEYENARLGEQLKVGLSLLRSHFKARGEAASAEKAMKENAE